MRAVPSPASNLAPFFRWWRGGMSAFASGSGSASAQGAGADVSLLKFMEELNADCGNLPAWQEELLARSDYLDGDGEEDEEAEVFSTRPLAQQDSQRQGQSQRGQAGDGEEGITMCSMPFTQTPPSSPSPASSSSSGSWVRRPRKPRICTRKVRGGGGPKIGGGAKIRTPTPSPRHSPTPMPSPRPSLTPMPSPRPSPTPTTSPRPSPTLTPSPRPSPELDPLVRIVLMIPTAPLQTTGNGDILELARSRGIIF